MHNKQALIYKKMGWDKHQFENLKRLEALTDISTIKVAHDIACGTGDFVNTLRSRGIDAEGTDLSPEMISRARQLYPNISFNVADMRTVQFSPVDLITINYFSLNMVPTADDIKKPWQILHHF
jgi:trans-aconitate methyltransferase